MLDFDDARTLANTRQDRPAARHEVAVEVQVRTANAAAGRRTSSRSPPAMSTTSASLQLDAHRRHRPRPGHAVPPLRLDQPGSAVDGRLGALRPGHREPEPARLRLDRPSLGNGGPRNYGNAFLPAVYQGTPLGKAGVPAAEATIRNLGNDRLSVADQRQQFDLLQESERRAAAKATSIRRRSGAGGRHRLVRAGLADAEPGPGRARPVAGDEGDAEPLRHRRQADRQLRPAVPAWPGGCARPACATCRSPTATTRANPAWDQHSNLPKHADHARAVDRPHRRPARRPEAARPAGGHARLVGRRVRPHALCREERHRPRPQPRRLHGLAGRRRRQARLRLRRHRRVRPSRRRRTRSTCTTCTPRSCTCWASITRS